MSKITIENGLRLKDDGVRDDLRVIFHGDEPHEDIRVVIPVSVWDHLVEVVDKSNLNDNDSDVRAFTIAWPEGWGDAATVSFEIDPKAAPQVRNARAPWRGPRTHCSQANRPGRYGEWLSLKLLASIVNQLVSIRLLNA